MDAMRRCLAAEDFAETSVATASSAANAGTVADNMTVVAAMAANARESLFILLPLGSIEPTRAASGRFRQILATRWSDSNIPSDWSEHFCERWNQGPLAKY